MWWRLKRSEFEKEQGGGNKTAMQAIVNSGEVPGILVYHEQKAVAWCSIAPRANFASLNRSFVLKPLDDQPVWSIVCLFIDKQYRKSGLTEQVIKCAIDYAKTQGANIVEAYPTQPKKAELPPVSSFMGIPAMYEKLGFVACARPSASKVVMRFYIKK